MIWLIGNKGMLGTELEGLLASQGFSYIGSDRELSILDREALLAFGEKHTPRWIVNCAAYTAVDKAEQEVELCGALNRDGPENIALVAERIGASLLHLSTDYVFSGTGQAPYGEDEKTAPAGMYGRTKADGEQKALRVCKRTLILRSAWLYGKHGPNFVTTMLRLMKEKDEFGVVADQRGSPTWARDLAGAIITILKREDPVYGIFHYTNEGETTWYEFALEIKRLALALSILERDCLIKPLGTEEYPTLTRRPAYSVLVKEKIKDAYGISIPHWKDSLARYMKEDYQRR